MIPVNDRIAAARGRLRGAGIPGDEADLDARLLAEHALGWDTARLIAHGSEPEPAGFAVEYEALVARRCAREPMAYVLGHLEFWGLEFEVSPDVLIPRPETELVVEAALEALPNQPGLLRFADVGTGSGCLAVAVAHERPSVRGVATDVSSAALRVARRNAARHGVAARLECVETDLLDGIDGAFHLIVSNPPYVPDGDRAALPPEVRDHEPPAALFGGPDGLGVVRRLVAQAAQRLEPEGRLIFEFGFGQAEDVRTLVSEAAGLTLLETRRDLQGIARVAIAQRS